MITDIHSVSDFVVEQVKTYWPKRVEDYKAGCISTKVYIVKNREDVAWFDKLKRESNITDPACTLIIDSNFAILFLMSYIANPL